MTSKDTLPSIANLKIDKHALTVQFSGEPLTVTMNKYTRRNMRQDTNAPGVILMLAHGVGFFKEMWEPTIEDIFRLNDAKSSVSLIREIWSLDCPNHGEAYTQNEDILVRSTDRLFLWDYAEAFTELYKSGLLGRLDHRKHQVVLCGHSAGAGALVLATSFFNPLSQVPFSSIILVDPAMWTREWHGKQNKFYKMVVQGTPIRRDIWKNRKEASEWLRKTVARSWDKRVFGKYMEHGLRPLPTAVYPERHGVTLTTHRLAESFCFSEVATAPVYEAIDHLNKICAFIPVHLVYGNRNDMFDRELQNALSNPEIGRSFASIRRIDDAGHLVPHEKPGEVAKEILDIIYSQGPNLSCML